jgi:hypothetical protein
VLLWMAFRDANEDFFMATDTGALSCRPSMTAGVSAVEAGAAEVSRGIVSTLTLYGLFVSVVGARYARGCSDMSADRTRSH